MFRVVQPGARQRVLDSTLKSEFNVRLFRDLMSLRFVPWGGSELLGKPVTDILQVYENLLVLLLDLLLLLEILRHSAFITHAILHNNTVIDSSQPNPAIPVCHIKKSAESLPVRPREELIGMHGIVRR
jgi:hypothetical protein